MNKRSVKLGIWGLLGGLSLFQAGGCMLPANVLDPDVQLQAFLTFANEATVFLLDNLVAGL